MKQLLPYWPSFVAAGQVAVISCVLLGSLGYQFVLGEMPCPLCILQRFSFLLACVGAIGILRRGSAEPNPVAFQARCFAMTIIASIAGAEFSGRQILLHIVPPDAGYGPPVFGLHLYTWALITFACLIASSAFGLLALQSAPASLPKPVTNGLSGLIVAIGIVIALATFAMEGFAFLLPDNPVRYELFRAH